MNTCEESLQVVDRAFGGRWTRNLLLLNEELVLLVAMAKSPDGSDSNARGVLQVLQSGGELALFFFLQRI